MDNQVAKVLGVKAMNYPACLVLALLWIVPIRAQDAPPKFDPSVFPIPADSKSPYDFRGKPDFDYAPYEALYRAKTIGELTDGLEKFFKAWKADGRNFDDPIAADRYFRCKQALIRLYYVQGMMAPGDDLMMEFHPSRRAPQGDLAKEMKAAGVEEKFARKAEEIRVLYSQFYKDNPYPNGPPKDFHDLYAPMLKIIKDMLHAE
jgi:hypothetical protein